MQVASLWTPGYLYFAYWCRYQSLNIYAGEDSGKERWELWNRDVVEAFINPQPERFLHYYEFEVAPNNQWVDLEIDLTKTPFGDAGWDSHFEHATKVDAEHKVWWMEMRVPVKSMMVNAIHPGDEWRLNLYRADGPGDDTRRRFMCWSPFPPDPTHPSTNRHLLGSSSLQSRLPVLSFRGSECRSDRFFHLRRVCPALSFNGSGVQKARSESPPYGVSSTPA